MRENLIGLTTDPIVENRDLKILLAFSEKESSRNRKSFQINARKKTIFYKRKNEARLEGTSSFF
jgi:hypothetical protein